MLHKNFSDTSIYSYIDTMKGSSRMTPAVKRMMDPSQGAMYIKYEQLADVFYKIRHKSFNYQAKFALIKLYEKGIIKLLYNKNNNISSAMPFFKFNLPDGGYGIIINITGYSKMSKDESTVTIDPYVLYSLMLSGTYSLIINDRFLANSAIPDFYGNLFTSIAARLSTFDVYTRNKIKYLSVKFLNYQLGLPESNASANAEKSIKELSKDQIYDIDSTFPEKSFTNFEELINSMRERIPEFRNITFGIFFDKWMRYYGEASGFAIEYIPCLIFILTSLVLNCNSIINIKVVEKEALQYSKDLTYLFNRIEQLVIDIAK